MTGESDLPPDLATRADDPLRSGIPNLDLLAGMSVDSFEASGLDHDTLVVIWLAALVALDGPSESYLMNLGAASQTGVTLERVDRVLEALAPIVGAPRVVSATLKSGKCSAAGAPARSGRSEPTWARRCTRGSLPPGPRD
jgi:alkylhydroperoxidase/carboxymuconolactone decarboxylase family protein YurZ